MKEEFVDGVHVPVGVVFWFGVVGEDIGLWEGSFDVDACVAVSILNAVIELMCEGLGVQVYVEGVWFAERFQCRRELMGIEMHPDLLDEPGHSRLQTSSSAGEALRVGISPKAK